MTDWSTAGLINLLTWSDIIGQFLPFMEKNYPILSGRTAWFMSCHWTWQMGLTLEVGCWRKFDIYQSTWQLILAYNVRIVAEKACTYDEAFDNFDMLRGLVRVGHQKPFSSWIYQILRILRMPRKTYDVGISNHA